MIKENQRTLNVLNVLLDAMILVLSMPLAFWIRFYVFHNGIRLIPLRDYLALLVLLVPCCLGTFATLGLYESLRNKRIDWELSRIFWGMFLNFILVQTALFLYKEVHFSRATLVIFFVLAFIALSIKRVALRTLLHYYRKQGWNQKHVLLVGDGIMARRYLSVVFQQRELGYLVDGYLAQRESIPGLSYWGRIEDLAQVLECRPPDEVVVALSAEEFYHTSEIIQACEKEGIKLSIIPFYAEYMPSNPQIDNLSGVPLMNIRHIPLDNWVHGWSKRAMDICGSLVLLVLTSPILLVTAIGVKLSSPGPVLFRQTRVGRDKKEFQMYKFRSMRVNDGQDTAWSTRQDSRKTRFGAWIRKCSIDELPQLFNVLKGDMSLVGPRPELPHFVQQFKEEIPLYMVKHRVRPGMTGWAQVNGFRGDTSILERIRHDLYYIENWDFFFDIRILFMTITKGMVNDETISPETNPEEEEGEQTYAELSRTPAGSGKS